jgi:hypothetical protein
MGDEDLLTEPSDGDPESPLKRLGFPLHEFLLDEFNNLTLPNWNSSINNLAKLSTKVLFVCGRMVKLEFPEYPPISDLLGGALKYAANKAYDALDNTDCSDDYRLGVVAKPASTTEGGKWITEHPMEAQTLQQFFKNLLEHELTNSDIPSTWRIAGKSSANPQQHPNPCNYFENWWNVRKDVLNNGLSAMTYLLQEFPGDANYLGELAILKEKYNLRKERILKSTVTNFRGKAKYKLMSTNARINELRDWLLTVRVGYY